MNKKYYPIEVFHWSGMKDENINELINILNYYPEYVHEKNRVGDNCLFVATRSGNIKIVKYIIENTDIDINYISEEGNVFFVALENNKQEIIKYLLTKNIDLSTKNKIGKNIFHLAAKKGDSDLIEILLEKKIEKLSILDLDKNNRHCLFDLIENYSLHKNYWCFDLIQSNFPNSLIYQKDNMGINIIEFIKIKQKELLNKYETLSISSIMFEPLLHLLVSRNNKLLK